MHFFHFLFGLSSGLSSHLPCRSIYSHFTHPQFIFYPTVRDQDTRVEAGSNTSTVALRVVGGDEKGSLESETVKYGHESHGTRTRE
jgi:hypothetical protein